MERHININFVTMATTLVLLIFSTPTVFGRPHVRPALTLADLDEDGAIPNNAAITDEQDDGLIPFMDNIPERTNPIRFEAVDLPSHFDTYDLNHDRRVSLTELAIVTGTKEIDALGPFTAADKSHDKKLSYEEFEDAPWIFGAAHEGETVDILIHDLVGEDL